MTVWIRPTLGSHFELPPHNKFETPRLSQMPEISIEQMIYDCCDSAIQAGNLEWTQVVRLLNQKLASLSENDRRQVLYRLELMIGNAQPSSERRLN